MEENFAKITQFSNQTINNQKLILQPKLREIPQDTSGNSFIYTNGDVSVEDYKKNYCFVCKLCTRRYSSITGLNYHTSSFNHSNPPPNYDPHRISKRGRPRGFRPPMKYVTSRNFIDKDDFNNDKYTSRSGRRVSRPGDTPIHKRDIDHVPKLTYAESQRLVDIEHNNTYHRLAIEDSLEMIVNENSEQYSLSLNRSSISKRTEPIPTAEYCIKDEYGIITYENPILTRSSYFRPYENFEQVMADNVEYEMDEEDVAWLNYINSNFLKNKETVQAAEFEYILDRLEKESEFIVKNTDGSLPGAVEEDVVCAICLDGDCSNNNLIVFCDICNTPVHQDCYGLPYVPEGQWLCRRCSHAPSLEIECALCSIKNGVFKQTTDGRWCHVICAIMIPGAKFINTVFLEPIDLSDISSSRFNVRCKICCQIKGAVIQCVFHQCTIPFHVSCAQSSGLLFVEKNEVSTNDDSGLPLINHRYLPYCSKHCPSTNVSKTVNLSISAVKNTTSPATIHVPIVLESLLQQLASGMHLENALELITLIKRYWQIKRYLRSGVPLLRRHSCVPRNPVSWFKVNDKQISQLENVDGIINHLTVFKKNIKDFISVLGNVKEREILKRKRSLKEKMLHNSVFNFNQFFDNLIHYIEKSSKIAGEKLIIDKDFFRTIIQSQFQIINLTNIEQFSQFLKEAFKEYMKNSSINSKQHDKIFQRLTNFISISSKPPKVNISSTIFTPNIDIIPSNIDTNVLVKSLTSGLPELEEYVYPDQNRIKINSLVWAHLGKVKYFPGRVLQIKVEQQLSTTTNSDEEQSEVVNIHVKFLNTENTLKWILEKNILLLGTCREIDNECLANVLNSKSYGREVKKNCLNSYVTARSLINQSSPSESICTNDYEKSEASTMK